MLTCLKIILVMAILPLVACTTRNSGILSENVTTTIDPDATPETKLLLNHLLYVYSPDPIITMHPIPGKVQQMHSGPLRRIHSPGSWRISRPCTNSTFFCTFAGTKFEYEESRNTYRKGSDAS